MVGTARGRPIDILLVEDNPGDVRLVLESFRDAKVANKIQVVEDGVEALAYLRRQANYASASRPDLILLDLSLPKMGGLEVLAEVKQDPKLRQIPIVVITSSHAERDVLAAYDRQVSCYLTKPVQLSQFMGVVRSIEEFWLTVVTLPPK